jgi:O-acetyl-ADP-ribose deacetylase (regulator of RNase III)
MLKYNIGDITKVSDVKYICNAANGVGIMGAGVAGAIRRAGGKEIEYQAKQLCVNNNIQPGDIYITDAGTLSYDKIIHLCTMKFPGSPSKLNIIEKCLNNLVEYCIKDGIQDIALSALGTGIGGVYKTRVAQLFVKVLSPIPDITFHVIDIDDDFITLMDIFSIKR